MQNNDPFSNVILTLGNTNPKGEVLQTRVIKGREAYSTYHLAYYVSEVIKKRKLQQIAHRVTLDELPRLDRDLALYTLLVGGRPTLLGDRPETTLVEFGGSVMELIDGLDLMAAHFGGEFVSNSIDYISIENDSTFNFVANALHPTHSITFIDDYMDWVKAPKVTAGPKILYDRAVSCYAIRDSSSLTAFIETFDVCLMQLYISMDGDFDYVGPEGSSFHYFDMEMLRSHFGQRMIHLYGKRRPSMVDDAFLNQRSVIEGYFLFANDEALCSAAVKTLIKSHYSAHFYLEKVTESNCIDFARVQRIIASN